MGEFSLSAVPKPYMGCTSHSGNCILEVRGPSGSACWGHQVSLLSPFLESLMLGNVEGALLGLNPSFSKNPFEVLGYLCSSSVFICDNFQAFVSFIEIFTFFRCSVSWWLKEVLMSWPRSYTSKWQKPGSEHRSFWLQTLGSSLSKWLSWEPNQGVVLVWVLTITLFFFFHYGTLQITSRKCRLRHNTEA